MKDLFIGLVFYAIMLWSLYKIGEVVMTHRIYKESISPEVVQAFLGDLRHVLIVYRWSDFPDISTVPQRKSNFLRKGCLLGSLVGITGFSTIYLFFFTVFMIPLTESLTSKEIIINVVWIIMNLLTLYRTRVWNFGSQLSSIKASLQNTDKQNE